MSDVRLSGVREGGGVAVSGAGSQVGDCRPVTGRVAHRRSRFLTVAFVLAAIATLVGGTGAQGQETILGRAQEFAVSAHTTITNTGPTVINGDLGLYPGTAVTGFPPGIVNGDIHVTNAEAAGAQADAETAFGTLQSRAGKCTDLTGETLGGTVGTQQDPLEPGVYCFDAAALMTGDLYLTGGGEYVFLIGSTLTTASGTEVIVVDQSQQGGCHIFWAVGSSATLGTDSQFVGTIIARTSITATTGADIAGRLIALDGAVTLDSNTVTRPECGPVPTTTTTTTPGTTTTAPPATTTTTAIPVTTITIPGTTITVPGTTIVVPGTTIVVPGTTIVVPGTTIVVPGTTIVVPGTTTLPATTTTRPTTTTTTTRPTTTTTAIPGTTTTTGLQGTTTTLQPGGGGPGPGPTTTAAPATTTTGRAATTTTTAAPATTTTARSATTTTTIRPGATGTGPGGGTGAGAGGPDSLRAAGAGEALALTGPTHFEPMILAALLAILLGAMMLMSLGPAAGGLLVAAGTQQGQRRASGLDLQRDAGISQGVMPPPPPRAQARISSESDSRRRDISPAEATRSALRSAESISWTLRLPEA